MAPNRRIVETLTEYEVCALQRLALGEHEPEDAYRLSILQGLRHLGFVVSRNNHFKLTLEGLRALATRLVAERTR